MRVHPPPAHRPDRLLSLKVKSRRVRAKSLSYLNRAPTAGLPQCCLIRGANTVVTFPSPIRWSAHARWHLKLTGAGVAAPRCPEELQKALDQLPGAVPAFKYELDAPIRIKPRAVVQPASGGERCRMLAFDFPALDPELLTACAFGFTQMLSC